MPRARAMLVLPALGAAAALSCQAENTAAERSDAVPLTLCIDPRPDACTREHLPVCGTRGDESLWTYANACSACGHQTVVGFRPGGCPD